MSDLQALPLIILRPEPGASATAQRAAALGLTIVKSPLFEIQPVDWTPPDPGHFDRLLMSSANAVRHAGPALMAFAHLPCWCVGKATARAARSAGLTVERVGTSDASAIVSGATAPCRILWLTGEDHSPVALSTGVTVDAIIVYRAVMIAIDPSSLIGPAVVMAHSARAARRLAQLAPDKARLSLVAISPAVAQAAGDGWREVAYPVTPQDAEMVGIAAKLCHDASRP